MSKSIRGDGLSYPRSRVHQAQREVAPPQASGALASRRRVELHWPAGCRRSHNELDAPLSPLLHSTFRLDFSAQEVMVGTMSLPEWTLRLARPQDIPALEQLIEQSVRSSLAKYYSAAQLEASLGPVFGVDRQLIRDGTYFAVEHEMGLIACGGWSKRKAVYGGDRAHATDDATLDPTTDAARIRAFFVHPAWERRGIGRTMLAASEAAIRLTGFERIELVATLAGEPLYARYGYTVLERYKAPIPGGLQIAVVRMGKTI